MKADARQGDAPAAERAQAATEAVLALAQKLHDEYVAEGQKIRERLISEGQSRHDQVVGEATARQEELLSTGQAKHDELIAEAEAVIGEAQRKRAEVLQKLGSERSGLQKEIEELRTIERDHRTHLKSYLEGQLIKLEQTGADETS
jgi:hypothetical protein